MLVVEGDVIVIWIAKIIIIWKIAGHSGELTNAAPQLRQRDREVERQSETQGERKRERQRDRERQRYKEAERQSVSRRHLSSIRCRGGSPH